MPKAESIPVEKLTIDLGNFRTVPQPSEKDAVHAMIAISQDRFWKLLQSFLDNGVLPSENILVQRGPGSPPVLLVKEGNRRVAALKLIKGILKAPKITIPPGMATAIAKLSATWKDANGEFPCIVYSQSEAELADQAVALIHGKEEGAGREDWTSVARARHNRDKNKASEPALDLLEKYIATARNITDEEKELWSGLYPLSVLEDALPKLATRLGLNTSREVVDHYSQGKLHSAYDGLLRDIGLGTLGFARVRGTEDFAVSYGFPAAATSSGGSGTGGSGSGKGGGGSGAGGGSGGRPTKPKKPKATSSKDPATVRALLRQLAPRGPERAKVVTLKEEALKIKIAETPIAFCFLLRSLFEISAVLYCKDPKNKGAPSLKKPNGEDKYLVNVLREITAHLIGTPKNKDIEKALKPAITELAQPNGLLSIHSMNQLVHGTTFVARPDSVCVLFVHVSALLDAMNA